MRPLNGVIGCVLLTLALLHAFIPRSSPEVLTFMVMYAAGAVFAFASVRSSMSLPLARVLAVGTTAIMFFYFAGFFKMATHFTETWYRSGAALEGVGMLLSAFAMIPVLSCYSCILKKDCRETLQKADHTSRRAFFSVPESVQEKAH